MMVLRLAASNGDPVARCAIVPAERHHIAPLAAALRDQDRIEIAAQGMAPQMVLRRSLRGSLWARTMFIDGDIAAMFGLGGDVVGDVGQPWLLTSAAVERMPVNSVRHAKAAVAEMLSQKPRLENHVLASYRGACRLLEVLGFTLEPPAPYGPGLVLFRRFWMER